MSVNRFVVECPEEHDDRDIYVYRPIETELTRDNLLDEIRFFYHEVLRDSNYPLWRYNHKLDLGGTGVMIEFDQIYHTLGVMLPRVMTVDEWFAAA